MSRLIDADLLYTQLQKDEELARKRVLDTESFSPYPNNLNPSYTRYVAQMNERTRLKHMVADAPTIEERKTGKWIDCDGSEHWKCDKCGCRARYWFNEENSSSWELDMSEWLSDFCPNCGADMRGEE